MDWPKDHLDFFLHGKIGFEFKISTIQTSLGAPFPSTGTCITVLTITSCAEAVAISPVPWGAETEVGWGSGSGAGRGDGSRRGEGSRAGGSRAAAGGDGGTVHLPRAPEWLKHPNERKEALFLEHQAHSLPFYWSWNLFPETTQFHYHHFPVTFHLPNKENFVQLKVGPTEIQKCVISGYVNRVQWIQYVKVLTG